MQADASVSLCRLLGLSIAIIVSFGINQAYAAPPGCPEMVDATAKNFAEVRKMAKPSPAKCSAISRVISELTDIVQARMADQKFLEETCKPVAKAVGGETPKFCQR